MENFTELTCKVVKYYFSKALEKYPNLSSFAIVSCESFDNFGIAINTDGFFDDLQSMKICDEVYWNTADWLEEMFDVSYKITDMSTLEKMVCSYSVTPDIFIDASFEALKSIREANNEKICLSLHLTDHGYDPKLHHIVKELNSKEVAESYKEYHLG